jgi:hypothetical protein
MNRWRVGEDRGSKETDRCPLTGMPLSCFYRHSKNYSETKDKKQSIYQQSGTFKLVHHPCLPQSFMLELHIGVCCSNIRAEEVDKCDEPSVSKFHFYFLCRSNSMTLAEG